MKDKRRSFFVTAFGSKNFLEVQPAIGHTFIKSLTTFHMERPSSTIDVDDE
jgi:hypothetical protein